MHSPTDEQLSVHIGAKSLMASQRGLIKCVAGAGCGKTTTLAGAARECKKLGANTLYLAFNKALVEDGNTAFKGLATVRTFNALAFEATGAKSSGRKIGPLYPRQVVQAFDLDKRKLPIEPNSFAKIVLTTITTFCNSASLEIDRNCVQSWVKAEIAELAVRYARVLFEAMRVNQNTSLPLSHEVYVKDWHLNGCPGLFKYDLALLDEAQDASGVMLACLAFAQRAIYVGDSCQQIYAWRGAQDAMLKLPGKAYPLSLSFRFGPVIADMANRLLKRKAQPPAIQLKGLAAKGTRLDVVDKAKPHARIFRTNSTLIRDALALADCNTPFSIVGDLTDLKEKFESAHAVLKGNPRDVRHPALQQFENWDQLEDWIEEHQDSEINQVARLAKEYGRRAGDISKLMSGAGQSNSPVAVLTTAHKSKGREFDNVVLSNDFDFKFQSSGLKRLSPSQRDEELNLLYVALTRTRNVLESQSEFLNQFI